jgi:integrase
VRWKNVSFDRKIWHVPYTDNKSGKSYEVILSPAALAVLEQRWKDAEENAIFVFPGIGKEQHVMDLKRSWTELQKGARIPDITIHDLRRSHGSYLAVSGGSLQTIGQALGHRSTANTQIYSQLLSQSVREAQDKSERKMRELMASAAMRERRSRLSSNSGKKIAEPQKIA